MEVGIARTKVKLHLLIHSISISEDNISSYETTEERIPRPLLSAIYLALKKHDGFV